MTRLLLVLAVLQALHQRTAVAEFVSGTISSKTGFHFMAKFCYDYTPKPEPGMPDTSTMTLSIIMAADSNKPLPPAMRLYVFDDQSNSWPAVYEKDIPCGQKIAKSRNSTAILWNSRGEWIMPLARIHEHIRPRFWYIVAANCRGFDKISYEVKFVNQGGEWKKQFGVNEQGLNTLYIFFFVIYSIGIGIHAYSLKDLWMQGAIHPIVKLLSTSIFLQFGSIFCGLVHYWSFVSNGYGVPFFNSAGECLNVAARLCFTLLLILIAEGWTISTDAIKNKNKIFLTMGLFVLCYSLLVIWDVAGRDPASTLYVYESWPGILIIVLDVIMTLWFVSSIYQSHTDEDDEKKKRLYEMIGVGYSIWFISIPALVIVATFVLDPWSREFTVQGISLTISTVAYTVLVVLLWPGQADEYFRISTPDVMTSSGDGL